MTERVSALDASFLYMDEPTTPMHVGSVAVFQTPPGGFDHSRLVELIRQRLAFVPRYRMRIRQVPFGIARPVWVDDEHFDITYHVRRSALPKPGSTDQLNELVGRLMGRPLDKGRPLWEMYLIEGLSDGRFALVTKTHQALVDGLTAIDITQVIMDPSPDAQMTTSDKWSPRPEPTGVELVASALTESLVHPAVAMDAVRTGASQVASLAGSIGGKAIEIAMSAVSIATPAATTPLNVTIGEQRRFATADFSLEDFKEIHRAVECSVNDVMLGALTGALRIWLTGRGTPISSRSQLRAVVPFSTADATSPVSAFLVDLPTGEPDPIVRLRRISYETSQLKDVAQLLGAESIINVAGFGPPTLHALGARLASRLSSRVYNLAITNVPGPQQPLYVAGSRLLASYPVMPLTKNQAMSIGLTSYDGGVFVSVNADRDSVRDLADFVGCMRESLDELRQAARLVTGRVLRIIPSDDGPDEVSVS